MYFNRVLSFIITITSTKKPITKNINIASNVIKNGDDKSVDANEGVLFISKCLTYKKITFTRWIIQRVIQVTKCL